MIPVEKMMLCSLAVVAFCIKPYFVLSFSVNSITTTRTHHQRPTTVSFSSSAPAENKVVTDDDDDDDNATGSIVERPIVHWTVPNFKVGWQDEEGKWYDEDGSREGPPLNYWRQRMDSREYKKDMDVVTAVLQGDSETIEELIIINEKSRSVRFPSVSRKLLGEWAPLMRCGKSVVLGTTTANDNDNHDKSINHQRGENDGIQIEVPWKVTICRTEGRQFGEKNNYGLFDAQLKEGESVTIKTSTMETSFVASKANEPIAFDTVDDVPFYLGGLTYITDYLLIQRSEEGDIDLWLRCDDSYLGKNKKEEELTNEEV